MRRNIRKFFILFFLNVVAFLPLIVFGGQNFSVDSYKIFFVGPDVHVNSFIGSYRYFGALVYKVITLFSHNPIENSTVDAIVFVVLVSILVTILTNEVVKLIGKEDLLNYSIVNISIYLCVTNIWFCDILSFPECIIICAVGFCLCFGAIVIYIRNQSVCGCVISGVLLICATAVYQQFIAVYTIMIIAVCGITTVKNKIISPKEIILSYLRPGLLVICSGVIYFLSGKIISDLFGISANSRISLSFSSMFENLWYYLTHMHSYLKGRAYFSSDVLTISYIAIGVIWFVVLVMYTFKKKHIFQSLLLSLSFVSAFVVAFLPGFLTSSFAPRVLFSLFSVFALFSFGILSINDNKLLKGFVLLILIIVCFINIPKIVECELNLKKQNDIDEAWSFQIVENIDSYERITQNRVDKIYYCCDSVSNLFNQKDELIKIVENDYAEDKVYRSYSESVYEQEHGIKYMISLYAGRKFEFEKINSLKYDELFRGKEWDVFNPDEQMIYDGNTLYLCCY